MNPGMATVAARKRTAAGAYSQGARERHATAASDPHRRGRAELLPERLAVAAAFEDVAVAADQAPRGVGLVEKKLDAEPAYAERPHPLNVLRGALGHGVVDRVPAADVGLERV